MKIEYVIRFLRHIIDALEAQHLEVHDYFYEILCKYQMQAQQDCHFSYKHYQITAFNQLVTLKEAKSKISEGTTGLNVWEAALAVCEWAIRNADLIKDQNILELGSGTGLSGLVIAKCCRPASMILTDGNDKVMEYLCENVANNTVDDVLVKTMNVNWVSIADEEPNMEFLQQLNTTPPSLIIAADVIYDNTLFQALCETLDLIFRTCKNECTFILANAVRNENTQKEFFDILGTANFDLLHLFERTTKLIQRMTICFSGKFNFRTVEEELEPPTYLHWEINGICPIKIYRIRRQCK